MAKSAFAQEASLFISQRKTADTSIIWELEITK